MDHIKNIILDYGNVIFMIDFLKAEEAFGSLGIKEFGTLFSHAGQHQLFDDFDKGIIDAAGFRQGIRDFYQLPLLKDEEIDGAWNALLIGVPQGYHELLLKLKERYRLFLLSNNNEIHYNYVMNYLQKEFGISDNTSFFEKDYYSHLMGMRKPDAEIFEFVLQEHGLEPQETLFIDDSPQHLLAAAKLGIHTQIMTQPDTLPDFVNRAGLLREV